MNTAQINADAFAHDLNQDVKTLLVAKALALTVREKADKIQAKVLIAGGFSIQDPAKAWHMEEEEAATYYAQLDVAYAEAGYKLEAGYCPALMAESDQLEAEWAVIKTAEKHFPHITNNRLLCGTKGKANGLQTRKDYIELCVKIVVNHPVLKDQFQA